VVVEVGLGDVAWDRPCDLSAVGCTQLPAPPRPVCRYSGGGADEVTLRERSWTSTEFDWDSISSWEVPRVSGRVTGSREYKSW
jgi:hypothetical protein